MEDIEFVNAYIERLNKALHDLISRNIILETRLVRAEEQNSALQSQISILEADLEKARKKKGSFEESQAQ
jgi:hypothetical protein